MNIFNLNPANFDQEPENYIDHISPDHLEEEEEVNVQRLDTTSEWVSSSEGNFEEDAEDKPQQS